MTTPTESKGLLKEIFSGIVEGYKSAGKMIFDSAAHTESLLTGVPPRTMG